MSVSIYYFFDMIVLASSVANQPSLAVRENDLQPVASSEASIRESSWAELRPGVPLTLDHFTMDLDLELPGGDYQLNIGSPRGHMIQSTLREIFPPIHLYLSPLRNYILANGACGTKTLCAIIVDLKTGVSWRVSDLANEMYYQENLTNLPSEAGRLYVSLIGHDISPDETKVLLKPSLVSVTYPNMELAQQDAAPNYFRQESYVVNLHSGAVLRVIRANSARRPWWQDQE